MTDDIGNGGVRRTDITGATGIVAGPAIVLMLDQDVVPADQIPVAAIMTDGTGLTGIAVRAEANRVIYVPAAAAVIVVGEIANMALVALPIGCRSAGRRALQPAIGVQIMADDAAASGMDLPRT